MSLVGIIASSVAKAVVYNIGDIGPGGGIVFYDAGSTLSWGRYMEAATSSIGWSDNSVQWSGTINVLVGTSQAIGTGRTNNSAAYAQNSTANRAVSNAWSFSAGGFQSTSNANTGWFLPSLDDLRQLYAQRSYFTFNNDFYWSSSEDVASESFNKNMVTGGENDAAKSTNARSRAIRYFTG